MFGHRYFGARYFGQRYFGRGWSAGTRPDALAELFRALIKPAQSKQRFLITPVTEKEEFGRVVARQLDPPARSAQVLALDELEFWPALSARSVYAAKARGFPDHDVIVSLTARRGLPSRAFLEHFLNTIA